MINYKSLKVLSFDKYFDIDEEMKLRKNPYMTIETGIYINPVKRGEIQKDVKYELFCNPIKEIQTILEDLYTTSDRMNEYYQYNKLYVMRMLFFKRMIVNEIQSTNEIEGVQSTKRELQDAIANIKDKNKSRFISIISMYLALNSSDRELEVKTAEDIRKLYDKLFMVNDEYSEIDNIPDGKLFRKDTSYIESFGKLIHTGVRGEDQIIDNMNTLIAFNKREDINSLIKHCISHYYFEYNHPFYDGNGRIGRFLISLAIRDVLDIFTALSISYGVNFNKKKYDKMFKDANDEKNYGDLTLFVLGMLEIIKQGQDSVEHLMKKIIYDIEQVVEIVNAKKDLHEIEKKVLLVFAKVNIVDKGAEIDKKDIQKIIIEEENLKLSQKSIDRTIKSLEEKGFLQISKKRPKIYKIVNSII